MRGEYLKTHTEWVPLRNYLRVRGEYCPTQAVFSQIAELPPRARRIHHHINHITRGNGTTSACAENTTPTQACRRHLWNYLRVRGEYFLHLEVAVEGKELPPRARRILGHAEGVMAAGGTTSACAENTSSMLYAPRNPRNYLRVRGEYAHGRFHSGEDLELPPRARRIPPVNLTVLDLLGTTSACAENTLNELGLL